MNANDLFIEETILHSVETLLIERVNELLGECEFPIPLIEFSPLLGGNGITPELHLCECERTEKERIVEVEAYTLTIRLRLEGMEGGRQCYAYGAAIGRAVREENTFWGAVDRAFITGKKYTKAKTPFCAWEALITLRITVEGVGI